MAIRSESRARARALQLLYAWETDGRPALEALLPGIVRLTNADPALRDRVKDLAGGVIAQWEALDRAYAPSAEHWRVDRLAVVDRNILRLGVYELMEGAVPPKVVIDQALWLAHRFGGPQSPAFINGVLDAVARTLGRL
jgi:N utilization substance protein B